MTLLPSSLTHLLLPLFLLLLLRLLLVSLQWRTSSSAIIMSLKNHRTAHPSRTPTLRANQTTCPIFSGTWVRDDSLPLYQYTCPFIDPEYNCQMYGRPDSGYLKYRWKPLNCELPRFNGVEFLERMKGKSVMFVGDSLGKNQWESLACLIHADAPQTQTQMARGDPLSTLKFLDYGVTISFYKARYLVDIDVVQGRRVLQLDDISGNGNAWREADLLSFNTGHWWSHTGSLQDWDVMESGGSYYQDMDRGVAMERALRTWTKWVDANIDRSRTGVFFLAISPTHYNPAEWSAGATAITTAKNCYGETVPMSGTAYPGEYLEQMRVVDEVLKDMHNPAYLLDITMLSALRKDGHPSIYCGELNQQQRAHPDRYADCSHWCLPGLPDTWNQLFYTSLFY